MNEVQDLSRWLTALRSVQRNRSLGTESSEMLSMVIRDLTCKLSQLKRAQRNQERMRKILFEIVARISWIILLNSQILEEIMKHWRDHP